MNDDNQFSFVGDEAMEARIIAWVLGEASPFEAEELERICQEQPKWAAFKRRIMQLHGLLEEASRPAEEEWSLPAEKRAAVESVLHSHTPKHRQHSVAWWRMPSVQAAAASIGILGVAGALLAPALFGKIGSGAKYVPSAEPEVQSKALRASLAEGKARSEVRVVREMQYPTEYEPPQSPAAPAARQKEVFKGNSVSSNTAPASSAEPAKESQDIVTAGNRSGDGAITRNSIDAVLNNPNRVTRDDVDLEGLAKNEAVEAPRQRSGGGSDAGSGRGLGMGQNASTVDLDMRPADGLADADRNSALSHADPFASDERRSAAETKYHSQSESSTGLAVADAAPAPAAAPKAESIDSIRRNLYLAEGNYNLGKYDEARNAYQDILRVDPSNVAARRGMEMSNQARRDSYKAAYDESRSALLSQADQSWERIIPPAGEPAPAKPAEKNGAKPADAQVAGKDFANVGEFSSSDQALRAQEEKVEESRKVLDQMVRTKAFIYDGDQSTIDGLGVSSSSGAASATKSYVELEKDKVELQSQVDNLQKYDSEQQMNYASSLDLPNNEIKTLHPLYLEKQRELRALQSEGLGADHPSVKAKQAQIAETQSKLTEETAKLRAQLNAELKNVGDRLAKADALRKGDERDLLKRSIDQREFIEAKTRFDAERKKLEEIRLQLQQKKQQAEPAKPKPDVSKEISSEKEPFSTFSLHVSDASFRLAVAAMARGEWPAADRVRVEEFYNAFEYGDSSPSANEPVACAIEQAAHPYYPQRNLIRIGVRTGSSGRGAGVPLHLTVLLDNSGSMERDDRRESVRAALVQLSSLLGENDTITLVGFAREPRLVADRLNGAKAGEIVDAAMRLPAEGGTNLEQALTLGHELAKRQYAPGAQNRIVLLTDGAANLGNAKPEDLAKKIEELRQQGIAFDAAGIGAEGLNDKMLEALTRKGDGRYYIVRSPDDADAGFAKKLAGAFRPAAENVKVQVRWNPRRVKSYLLNGFEEHRLNKEDFRNDAVDAAEMAAEEAGQALYQAAILPEGEGELGEISVRFHDAASGKMVERTWTIPYAPSAPAFDRATPSMQLAGLALMTAEKLRGGPLATAIEMTNFTTTTANVRAHYANDKRIAELIEMIGKLK